MEGFYDFIEIGTSDFDTLIQSCDEKTVGLSIDALKYYLDRLPNKENVEKLCYAISDQNGEIEVYSIKEDDITKYNLPPWTRGCNKIGEPHPTINNILLSMNLDPESIWTKTRVPMISFSQLVKEYNIKKIDYLKIDTEGHDPVIMKAVAEEIKNNLSFEKPLKITFETNVLSSTNDQDDVINIFTNLGYRTFKGRDDTTLILENETTFVTAFYNLEKNGTIELYEKELESYFSGIDFLMSVPGTLVIFTEEEYIDRIREAVEKYRKYKSTEIILKKWEDLYWVSRFDEILNVTTYSGRTSHDDSPEFIPIMWEKLLFVKQAIDKYKSKYYSWIDFGLGRIEHYGENKAFQINSDKIRFMMSNIHEFQNEYYKNDVGLSLCAAGYITGSAEYFEKLFPLFTDEVNYCLNELKCTPREETILSNLVNKNPDIFNIYYGDSNHCMLTNYSNYYHLLDSTLTNLNNNLSNKNYKRIVNICENILDSFKLNQCNMTVVYLFSVLDNYIIALYYTNNVEKGKEIIELFKNYTIFENFNVLYLKHKSRIDQNFSFF